MFNSVVVASFFLLIAPMTLRSISRTVGALYNTYSWAVTPFRKWLVRMRFWTLIFENFWILAMKFLFSIAKTFSIVPSAKFMVLWCSNCFSQKKTLSDFEKTNNFFWLKIQKWELLRNFLRSRKKWRSKLKTVHFTRENNGFFSGFLSIYLQSTWMLSPFGSPAF